MNAQTEIDWYARRNELSPGQMFRTHDGRVIKLDRQVPGDATQWTVLDFWQGRWFDEASTIEPGDLDAKLEREPEINV